MIITAKSELGALPDRTVIVGSDHTILINIGSGRDGVIWQDEQCRWLAIHDIALPATLLRPTTYTAEELGAAAHEIWQHATGPLCGDPLCRYVTGGTDGDYECECAECIRVATEHARHSYAALGMTEAKEAE